MQLGASRARLGVAWASALALLLAACRPGLALRPCQTDADCPAHATCDLQRGYCALPPSLDASGLDAAILDALVADLRHADAIDADARAPDTATAADGLAVVEAGGDAQSGEGPFADIPGADLGALDAPAGDAVGSDALPGDASTSDGAALDAARDAAYADLTAVDLGVDAAVSDGPGSELVAPDLGQLDAVVTSDGGSQDLPHLDIAAGDRSDASLADATPPFDAGSFADSSSVDGVSADVGVCAFRQDQWSSECCGNFGELCCEGTTCTASATCVGTTCVICGAGWEYCCDGTRCGSKQVCGADGQCVACGGNLQPCCLTGQPCTSVNSLCCIVGDVPLCVPDACI